MLSRAARPDPTRFMEALNQRPRGGAGGGFTGSDRFLGLFSPPESAITGLELHEDEIFSSGSESTLPSPMTTAAKNQNPKPNANNSASARRRISDRSFGILAALPDWNPNPNLISPVSVSCSSSAMMIPPSAKPKPKQEKVQHRSSAPVRIPVVNVNAGNRGMGFGLDFDRDGDDDDDETMMMPPHEIVARRDRRREPSLPMMTSFSVLEGAGRTLKGRDLRRVRNTVFRTIGFED